MRRKREFKLKDEEIRGRWFGEDGYTHGRGCWQFGVCCTMSMKSHHDGLL